jgi:MFS family permease
MLVPLYLIYMSLYMKLIFLPIINDDHFLAFCSVLLTVSAIIGAPFWGYVGDKKGFKFTLLTVLIFDFAVKIFGLFCQQKWNLMILYFTLGFNDKGILTIVGPGLIEIFGLELAT